MRDESPLRVSSGIERVSDPRAFAFSHGGGGARRARTWHREVPGEVRDLRGAQGELSAALLPAAHAWRAREQPEHVIPRNRHGRSATFPRRGLKGCADGLGADDATARPWRRRATRAWLGRGGRRARVRDRGRRARVRGGDVARAASLGLAGPSAGVPMLER